jgi:hypothetical protein
MKWILPRLAENMLAVNQRSTFSPIQERGRLDSHETWFTMTSDFVRKIGHSLLLMEHGFVWDQPQIWNFVMV